MIDFVREMKIRIALRVLIASTEISRKSKYWLVALVNSRPVDFVEKMEQKKGIQ